jgi:NADPH:quinone reductase-like Zn-dependent oxidoreductase
MFRQGDLLFVKIEANAIPNNAKAGDGILALGEATGHHHKLVGGDHFTFAVNDGALRQFAKMGEAPAMVTHQEHATIELPGLTAWEVFRQREYSPTQLRNVMD